MSYRLSVITATLSVTYFLCSFMAFVGFHLQLTYLALGLKDFVAYSKYHYAILDL